MISFRLVLFIDRQRKALGCAARTALCLVGLLPASHAGAQQAAVSSPDQIPEIVVTAQKRAQNEQDVPIAITTFTAQALQDKNIVDVQGLARLTPNVNLDTASPFGGSNQVLSASIRGIGQDDFGINLDPGVGVYVDGIYFARTTGANVNLLDVDQVEILKGPQGTLFGRNTIGGAINIVTRTPGEQFSIKAEATGGSYDRRDFQATMDVPFSETVLSTFTFSSLNRDGYQQRIPYPSSTPYVTDPATAFGNNGTETFSTEGGQGENVMRTKFLWKASAKVNVTFTGDWTHVDESSVPESLLTTITAPQAGVAPTTALFGEFYNLCLLGVFPAPQAPSCGNPNLKGANNNPQSYRLPFGSQYITGNPDSSYGVGPDYDKMDQFGAATTIDWEVADDTHLKSITGYRKLEWNVALEPSASPVLMNQGSFAQTQHQVSEEVQLTGVTLDDKLKYSAGLYYFDEQGREADYVTIGEGLLQIQGYEGIETQSYAGYFHVDYNVVDQLSLILGGRYSYDHKTLFESQPVFAVAGPAFATTPTGTTAQHFSEFTPTAGLQYQFTKDLMSYFTYSQGYKDGGWTTRLTAPLDPLHVPTFGPEKADTYELGVKSDWFDRTLQANADVFYTKYDSIQLNFQEGLSPTIENAGDADIKGVEFEGTWIIGGGFSLSATGGFMDAYYTYLAPGINSGQSCVQPFEACITTSSLLPKTPRWKYSVSPTYRTGLPNGASVRFGVDLTHESEIANDAINTSLLMRPTSTVMNASMTYASPDDKYELVLGGTNITKDRFLTTGNQDTTASIIYGTYNPPAEWYATARIKF
jgi:iron complex outermembrane receptor protein